MVVYNFLHSPPVRFMFTNIAEKYGNCQYFSSSAPQQLLSDVMFANVSEKYGNHQYFTSHLLLRDIFTTRKVFHFLPHHLLSEMCSQIFQKSILLPPPPSSSSSCDRGRRLDEVIILGVNLNLFFPPRPSVLLPTLRLLHLFLLLLI